MRRLLHPGYGLILLVTVAGFFTYLRLNKQDFYRHYFRVIAEVAERNSHELPQAVLTLGSETQEPASAPDGEGNAWLAAAWLAPQPSLGQAARPASASRKQSGPFCGLPPVRAP